VRVRDPVVHYYVNDYVCHAHVFGRINFDDLVKNLPIRWIKIPAKLSGYTVYIYIGLNRVSLVNNFKTY